MRMLIFNKTFIVLAAFMMITSLLAILNHRMDDHRDALGTFGLIILLGSYLIGAFFFRKKP